MGEMVSAIGKFFLLSLISWDRVVATIHPSKEKAIGANAAVDDVSFVAKKVSNVINPEPVKAKGFWRKK